MLPAQRQLAAPLNSEHRQRISSLGASTNPGAANQHASSPGIDSGEYTSISSEGRAGISLSFGSRMRPQRDQSGITPLEAVQLESSCSEKKIR